MKMTDKELLNLEGKRYTRKTRSLLKYGCSIDHEGNIIHVVTKKEMKEQCCL
jgi:hypothetical protein